MSEIISKRRTHHAIGLVVIGLFLVLGTVVFNETNRIVICTIRYWLDFRNWSDSLGVAFWLFFAWQLADVIHDRLAYVAENKKIRNLDRTLKIARLIFVVGFCCFFINSFISYHEIVLWLYFSIIMPYYFEPAALFFYDGTLTIRLLFLPTIAIIAIITMLYVNYHFKKRGNHDSSRRQK